MKDGFLKAAALSPALRVADCAYNVRQITDALHKAAARGVKLAVFPEFCLTGYTCGDLFLQRTLQTGALDALSTLLDETKALDVVTLVGLPLLVHGKLYNCAAVLCHGRILGLVPKTYLPNYGEFYEKRQFTPGSTEVELVEVCGQQVPFGTSLLFRCRQMPSFVLGVEICEDLWSALPPSTFHALAGATVIANLSASDETVGKAEYRRALVSNQSARLLCGYLYASAGHGESTQDMVFAGHDLIAENGTILAENAPFDGGCAETEIDCQRMEAERARNTSFELSGEGYQTVEFDLEPAETTLTRWIDPAPFVPGDPKRRAERCELILKMQADGLAKRLEHAHAKTAVIGISGGLDSCLALLVAVRAMKQLGRPARDLDIAITKHVPVCAGMAGGSSDAAAVLRALNQLEGSPFSPEELAHVGEGVGSDVPYCVLGCTALAQGRGEVLTPLSPLPHCWVVACKPDFPVSTPELFARIDSCRIRRRPDADGLMAALDQGDLMEVARRMYNVFEDVLPERQFARVADIKNTLIQQGALGANMSGTGPTAFGLFASQTQAQAAYNALKQRYQEVFLAETV